MDDILFKSDGEWTKEELKYLKRKIKECLSIKEIAYIMNCGESTIENKLTELKLRPKKSKYEREPSSRTFRGYGAVEDEFGNMFFDDNGEPVIGLGQNRECAYCGLHNTTEDNFGCDGCIGYIPGAEYACCGHGNMKDAYVAFHNNEKVLREQEAWDYMDEYSPNKRKICKQIEELDRICKLLED